MSFQTMKFRQNNYQEDFKIQPVKIKVPQLGPLDEEPTSKRFNRSQSRQNYNSQHNKPATTAQESLGKIYEQPYAQRKEINNRQDMLRNSKNMKEQVLMQKFIPYTLKELRKQNQVLYEQNILSQKGNIMNSPSLQGANSPLNRKFLDNQDKYTFRSFGNSSVQGSWQYGDNLQISDAKSIKSFAVSQGMSPRSPHTFLSPNGLKHEKSPMISPYNKKSNKNCEGNVSTEESFQEGKKKQVKKVSTGTIGIQTQNKKIANVGVCTMSLKMLSTKIQTEETNSSYLKQMDNLKGKIGKMEEENNRLKNEIGRLKKQLREKNQFSIPSASNIGQRNRNQHQLQQKSRNTTKSNHFKNKTEIFIQKEVSQTQFETQAEIQMSIENQLEQDLEKSSNKMREDHQLFKQYSLQLVVQNLKKQIEFLKSGIGLKKIQQVLEHLKRQNAGLVNQIQSISLRCRILQQQNNQIQVIEQENRKIKMQNKYFRGIAKDHQLEIEKLKNENNKLKSVAGHVSKKAFMLQDFQDSRLVSVCGSDADSLTLSCSFIKD